MAEIAPFRGIRYNPARIKDLSRVVCPPYDVISPRRQNDLYRAHPCNIIRIDFGKVFPADSHKNNRYIRAKAFLHNWQKKILIQDKLPSIYLYAQEYTYQDEKFTRWGFICRLKLRDDGSVLFHEKTSTKPKRDRFHLIKETKLNLNPVFSLFSDERGLILSLVKYYRNRKLLIDIDFDNVRHRLWAVSDKKWIRRIIKTFLRKNIFIADGHHRYEVSLAYQRFCKKRNPRHTGKEDYNYIMMYFTPLEDKALRILPTHRLLKELPPDFARGLERYFDIVACGKKGEIFSLMDRAGGKEHIFGMYRGKNKFCVLKLKKGLALDELIRINKPLSWKRLDVSILHTLVVEKIFGIKNSDFKSIIYTQDIREAIREVDRGNFRTAFFLNPTSSDQVKEVALDGARMPHKSTYFYPKLLSGLVINTV